MQRTLVVAAWLLGAVAPHAAAQEPARAALDAPKPTTIALDFSALVARRDSFAVKVQNLPLGWMRGVVERTEQGFRYVEDTRIGGLVEQHTVVEIGPKGEMRSVRQAGKVQGQPTTIELDYGGGRVKGTATTIGPQGAKDITIDTTIAPGTIDDNALNALLPILDFNPGAKWTFPVFSGGAGESIAMTLTVEGTETVALESGPVEAYRVELAGGPQPAALFVSTVAPHRLLRIAPAGAPVEIVRVP